MSEQDLPARPRTPRWLRDAPAVSPRFDEPGRGGGARSRPATPPSSGSGYEQILAARAAMRTRVGIAAAGEWRAPTDFASAAAPVAGRRRSPAQPHRSARRRRPKLIVSGLLAVPACAALLAAAWVGPPRSPVAPGTAAAPPSAGEEQYVLATWYPGAPSWDGDTDPEAQEEDVPARPALADVEAKPAMDVHPPAADAEPATPQGSASPRSAESGAGNDGSPPPFAAWGGDAHLQAAGGGSKAPASASAPRPTASEPAPASVRTGEPASAVRYGDAPARAAGAFSEGAQEDGPTPSTATAAAEAAEPQAGQAARVPAGAGPPRQKPAPSADPAFAALGEGPPKDAWPSSAAPAEFSGGPAPAPPQERVAALPLPMVPPLVVPPSAGVAPPAKLRPGGPPQTAPRAAVRDAPSSPVPPPDSRCRAIILKAQLGEETSHAERSLLRSGCGARR